jgi:hypothetical protein
MVDLKFIEMWQWLNVYLKTIQIDHNNFNYNVFPFFYVVETCSKSNFWFQILHYSKIKKFS